jgi:hypothetical protein
MVRRVSLDVSSPQFDLQIKCNPSQNLKKTYIDTDKLILKDPQDSTQY